MKEQYKILTQAFVARRVIPEPTLQEMVAAIAESCPGLNNEGTTDVFNKANHTKQFLCRG